jgi:hypothetical protein
MPVTSALLSKLQVPYTNAGFCHGCNQKATFEARTA